ALITVGFAAYDTYNYASGKTTGAEYAAAMALNGAALVADVATLGNGGGLVLRAANAGIRVARAVDKANDAYETVNTVIETGKVVASGDSAEISRAVASALVEQVVGGGKGKNDVNINVNAVKTKKLDGVDTKNPPNPAGSKGAPDHVDATNIERDRLTEKYADNSNVEIRSNQSLKDVDPSLTRKPDAAAVDTKDGKILEVSEVARTNADGTLVPRERAKLPEYEKREIPVNVIPIDKKAKWSPEK
ncbi:MAG: hypothetical protein ACREIA_00195, partial [Opitutaceae bacterium]